MVSPSGFEGLRIVLASAPLGNGGSARSRTGARLSDRVRSEMSGMSDITAAPANAISGIKLPGLGDISAFFKRGDIALAIGVLTILVVLILPLPPLLLDFALAISIIFSVLILMTALFIHTPLEFSAFPTVLLIATMLRLALNLASTRLILSRGHEGTDAAGHVIEAFGNFVMSGNFVIGIIVFAILVIVNFVVITKGSGRIAEVAARFHLDAMPGKRWRSTPICRLDLSTRKKRAGGGRPWKMKADSSVQWMAPPNSSAAMQLRACSLFSSTSSAG